MDGPAVDADPYGAVGIGKEGSLVSVVGDEAVALGEQLPMCAVEDVDAKIGSDPKPASAVEADELDVGGDDLRGAEDREQTASVSVDTEMKESGQAAADPECAVRRNGDSAHLTLNDGVVEGNLRPS